MTDFGKLFPTRSCKCTLSERICPSLFASNGSDCLEIIIVCDGVTVPTIAFICIVCIAEPLTYLHCSFVSHLLRFACLYDFSFSSVFLIYLYEFFIHCGGHRDFFFFFFKYLLHLTCWLMYLPEVSALFHNG